MNTIQSQLQGQIENLSRRIAELNEMAVVFKEASDGETNSPAGSPGWHSAKAGEWQDKVDLQAAQLGEHQDKCDFHARKADHLPDGRAKKAHEKEAEFHGAMAKCLKEACDLATSHGGYHEMIAREST